MENWDDLKFVLAMMRHGTMSAAARYLNTNVATVSRRLERMALSLDTPLFEKRGQNFVATEAARRLSALAEEVDQKLRAELSSLHAGDFSAPVPLELAAPPAVHAHYLVPRLTALSEHLPHVLLTLTDKVFAQGLGEADIQIRIGRPEGGRLKARKFRDYALRVFHAEDKPLGNEWIGLSHRYPDSDYLTRIHPAAQQMPRYRVEEMPMLYEAVRATGLPGLLPDFMVVEGDGLVQADLPDNGLPDELWITYHETRHGDVTLRAVVDWLCRTST
ncbi:LysR family transcriptional regulator [Jannaschia sp. W003]|uniref:LysR family transcriptional regulator n=1 Tax=Jannaschia sp. W003 TaxID=2867012 RepID=UPI0021A78487|nr:LysR family transcriptional regulator [Jannaschia sp. W003]UWQ20248.1 LysR family transcriptional regulator [Jannaschia sp. W003]